MYHEICGEFTGRRMYLELGEEGVLTARNESNLREYHYKHQLHNISTHSQCSLELITCPSCIISLKFTFLNISRNCDKNTVLDSCGCDYVWIYEPPFDEASGEQFCGHFLKNNSTSLSYTSQTRSVAISFLFSTNYDHAFTITFSSERNRQVFNGFPKYGNVNNETQLLTSPFFPYSYPRDLSIEYIVKCHSAENCRIRLIFSDFYLSRTSIIEFFDWNGQRMEVATGTAFRPTVIISSGPTLVIRFYANGGTSMGFKASYMFLLGDAYNDVTLRPNTDCGGYVSNLGGAITMMDMVKEGTKPFDCYWVIQPPRGYMHLQTHLYLKVVEFSDFGGNTQLTVRQGVTSNEPALETLRHPMSYFFLSKKKEHVVSLSQGFYVSLKGLFRPESRLSIVYTAFSYKECIPGSDFFCQNHRCIPLFLRCDGFNHCGDESDEPLACFQESKDHHWVHTPNFFFPKIDRYADLQTATVAFIICSMGLVALIFAMIILIYRINARARQQRQLQDHLQTISSLLEDGVAGQEDLITDEPPNYEAPPEYEEVIRTPAKGNEYRRTVRKSSTDSRSRSNSRKRSCSRCSRKTGDDFQESSSGSRRTSLGPFLDNGLTENENKINAGATSSASIPNSPPPSYSHITYNSMTPLIRIQETSSISSAENVSEGTEENPLILTPRELIQ
ncbi:uncharacterized protein LOC108737696 [Agrilus planipennis]|uniref:Uncharacterized protein LOC108737696 n=1 Tax=Agrilus planipennis TaxID=224129 RepID=A0A1W4WQQ7_AGRPL|nr:uncharacterized protein LOC108737696 [Agrilus planipennis]